MQTYVNDCKKEIGQHEHRCITEPDYCLDYVRCYGKQFGIEITENSLDSYLNLI